MNDLNFEIQTSPLTVEETGETLNDYKSVLRVDPDGSKTPLAVRGNKYEPFSNKSFCNLAKTFANIAEIEQPKFDSFNEGRKVLATCQNNNQNFYIGNNQISDSLVLGYSHDGTWSLWIGISTFLHRCKNMYSTSIKVFKAKSTASIHLRTQEFKREFEAYQKRRQILYNNFEEFQKIEVSQNFIDNFIKNLHNIDKDIKLTEQSKRKQNLFEQTRKDIQTETKELGTNLWGLFNGVTKFTTHDYQNGRNAQNYNLLGTASKLNDKAFNTCMKQLELATS